ncbi:putative ABC transporter permease subunit [Candidatus Viridilinea mediisalina]|nr:hypothetical protein [Candidatus Viridilinea mediisalina]
MRARLQITRNTFWRSGWKQKFGLLIVGLFFALGSLGAYGFTRFMVAILRDPELALLLQEAANETPEVAFDLDLLLATLPSLVLLGTLGLLIFSSFSSLLNSLYLSGDLDMLLATPTPMRAVFVVKFFGALSTQYLLIVAFVWPVLVGYGQGMGYGLLYQFAALVVILGLPLLPAGLGALLVMAVIRVIPPRRAREIVSLLGGMLGVGFYLLIQFSGRIAMSTATPANLESLRSVDQPLLPSAWAGRALVAAGEGQLLPLAFYGGSFLLSSVLAFGACLLLAERLYYVGWSNLAQQGGKQRPKPQAPRGALFGRLPLFLPQESRAILVKDLRLFVRDLRNLQVLIFPLALALIWSFQILMGDRASASGLGGPEQLMGASIAFFICISISNGIAGGGVSREGKNFWLLKLAPISPWRLLLGKLALAYLPFPVIGTLFLLGIGLLSQTNPLVVTQQWVLLQLVGLGSASFGIGLGAAFPRLNWENPAQQTTWQSSCLSSIFYPLYILFMLVIVFGAQAASSLLGGGLLGLAVILTGWGLAVGLTGLVVGLGALIGIRGLERIEV